MFPVDKHITDTRNNFAHFTMLRPKKEQSEVELNLTDEVNKARQLMAYDRKLKNAVSKSVIELLHREGLELGWHMKEHELADCVIRPRTINHLDKKSITENLHSMKDVKMVADIFGGEAEKPQKQHRNKGQKPHPKRKKR